MAYVSDRSLRSSDILQCPPPAFTCNTAYTGADGHIDILALDDDAYADRSGASSPTRRQPSALNSKSAAAALNRSKTILHSRAKSLAAWTSSFSAERSSAGNRLFGDIFSGESAPVRAGIFPTSPIKEQEETEWVMNYVPSFTERPSLGRRRTSLSDRRQSHTASKQGWLARKFASSSPSLPLAVPEQDELATININNALFPNGPADPLSPSAFNDLLLNATNLLDRMQRAYCEKIAFVASMQPELDVQREEVEEADTRAQHLKMQLEDMARRAQEHDRAVADLSRQLAEEKRRSHEAREALQQATSTVRMVNNVNNDDDDDHSSARPHRPNEWYSRNKRSSAGSASDSGFESDWDRDAESVVSAEQISAQPQQAEQVRIHVLKQGVHLTTFHHHKAGGQTASSSDVQQQLESENARLRTQVGQMQTELQGCIDLLDVLKL